MVFAFLDAGAARRPSREKLQATAHRRDHARKHPQGQSPSRFASSNFSIGGMCGNSRNAEGQERGPGRTTRRDTGQDRTKHPCPDDCVIRIALRCRAQAKAAAIFTAHDRNSPRSGPAHKPPARFVVSTQEDIDTDQQHGQAFQGRGSAPPIIIGWRRPRALPHSHGVSKTLRARGRQKAPLQGIDTAQQSRKAR